MVYNADQNSVHVCMLEETLSLHLVGKVCVREKAAMIVCLCGVRK